MRRRSKSRTTWPAAASAAGCAEGGAAAGGGAESAGGGALGGEAGSPQPSKDKTTPRWIRGQGDRGRGIVDPLYTTTVNWRTQRRRELAAQSSWRGGPCAGRPRALAGLVALLGFGVGLD